MKTVTSSSNALYKQWQRLTKPGAAREHGVLLEGTHVCQEWLARFGEPTWAIFKDEALSDVQTAALADQVSTNRQVQLSAKLMRSLSSMVSEPTVIFVVNPPLSSPPKLITESVVVLDGVQDPGNVGTILRTAAAAGVGHVVTGVGTANCWSAKALRAGQGAQFALSIHESIDLQNWLSLSFSRLDVSTSRPMVIATALDAKATALFDLTLPEHVIWVFGQEGRGVDPRLLKAADQCVYIPHDSRAVESLNVASAAAICLFEHRRQRLYAPQ